MCANRPRTSAHPITSARLTLSQSITAPEIAKEDNDAYLDRKRVLLLRHAGRRGLAPAQQPAFLGREIAKPRAFSDETAAKADEAVATLLRDAEARAEEVMTAHKPAVTRLIEALEVRETLSAEEIEGFLNEDAAAA